MLGCSQVSFHFLGFDPMKSHYRQKSQNWGSHIWGPFPKMEVGAAAGMSLAARRFKSIISSFYLGDWSSSNFFSSSKGSFWRFPGRCVYSFHFKIGPTHILESCEWVYIGKRKTNAYLIVWQMTRQRVLITTPLSFRQIDPFSHKWTNFLVPFLSVENFEFR